MSSPQEMLNKKQVIMNHVSDQIETLTKQTLEQLVAEFQLMVAEWVKEKELPDQWGGNAAPEAMMRTALYQSAHTQGLQLVMSDKIINDWYESVTNAKKAPAKKAAK